MLLWEIDGKFVDDLASVPSQGAEESPVTIHDDETKARVRFEELGKGFGVELVVTKIQRPEQVVLEPRQIVREKRRTC